MRKIYALLALALMAGAAHAQNDVVDDLMKESKPKHDYVAYTFKATRVICGQSIEMTKKNALDFRVVHRFGNIADNNAAHTLAGFYAISDVMFTFDYGITDDLSVGLGFSKGAGPVQELYDINLKYRLLKQTKDFKIPFTITLYGNAAVSGMKTDPFTGDPWRYTVTDSTTHVTTTYGTAAHRFSYLLQSLIAVKATDWLSVQLSPSFLWRNYVGNPAIQGNPGQDKNGMFFLGFQARAKVSKRRAIVFEYFLPITTPGATYRDYAPMLRGINTGYFPCINVGYEQETGGHVFTITLTNTGGLMENDFLPYTSSNWAKGQFRLGFTISRIFQFGDKHISPWTGKEPKSKADKKKEKDQAN
ncbi:unnamed protein product [Sphagnum jensenii]|uniref:DUF5777 domain-containing protein n=1 Tax=Sphagnum jensenii TaxID=128206 RepID=A0ABP1A2K2_9BRYO